MRKIGNFLFVEQCFTDTEETKPCVIHIDAIDSITCDNTSKLGMVVNKVKEGRKLTEIKFSNDHYLANLLATTKVLGISLERAKKLCRTVPGKRVEVNPPIEIISKLNTDKLFEELEEYEIEVSISIPSK